MVKKKIKNVEIFFSAIIIVVIALVILNSASIPVTLPTIMNLPQLSTIGYEQVGVSVEIGENIGVVKLASQCYEMTGNVEPSQALSIQNGLEDEIGPRPNTHDLFNDLLKALDIKILQVKVTELRDNTFIAQMIVQKGNTVVALDSRPSDAIAVTARTDYLVPILVKESLLKEVGRYTC